MLDKTDSEIVREWLADALRASRPHGITAKSLAVHCGVSPQAVNGWLKTGRISKSHLEAAKAYFGHEPRFNGEPLRAKDSAGAAWPLPSVTVARFARLPEAEKRKIDAHAHFVVSEWEKSSHGRRVA